MGKTQDLQAMEKMIEEIERLFREAAPDGMIKIAGILLAIRANLAICQET